MYVKSLTVKGFKSFASSTTLRLEPGITCVVGPNGSGKSNVVDAMAWVMGEQGAKSLRGGKMEDVFFAGPAGRPPLGRAEVALTIDNTDGALPIDYAEVTVSRTMFRTGGSDYAINGTPSRLLDIQELLADSGIGREMHVIVGQGQLDAILRATPEERRGFIEEAAGVLKHRRRKERALRKLDAMEANLTRVRDLTGEIRRQLGPLGRQAETARRAAFIQATVRDARARLLADDLVQLTATLEQDLADEQAVAARRAAVEAELHALRTQLADEERAEHTARPVLAEAHHRWFALTRLVDRFSSTASVAGERVRLLAQDEDADSGHDPGRDPDQLDARSQALRDEHRRADDALVELRDAVDDAERARRATEDALTAEQRRIDQVERAAAHRRESIATLAGRVAATASRVEAAAAEIDRLRGIADQVQARARQAEQEYADLEASIAVDEDGEVGLDAAHESADREVTRLEGVVADAAREEQEAHTRRQAAGARVEALGLALRRGSDPAAVADTDNGYAGSVASVLTVRPGDEVAVAVALGWVADAGLSRTLEAALEAVRRAREADTGRLALLVPETAETVGRAVPQIPPAALPGSARWARDAVTCPDWVRPAVDQVLAGIAIVPDLPAAVQLTREVPGVTAVTSAGDVVAPGAVHGGGIEAPSLVELQAALHEAEAAVREAGSAADRARFARATAQGELDQARERAAAALERLNESDARLSSVAERLGVLGGVIRGARDELARTERAIAAAEQAAASARQEHRCCLDRLEDARQHGVPDAVEQGDDRERLAAAAAKARGHETETRLALRTAEERARALLERADGLAAAADAERVERSRRRLRLERRRHEAVVADAVRVAADYAHRCLAGAAHRADADRRAAEVDRDLREGRLARLRGRLAEVGDQERELTDTAHRDEVTRTQQRVYLEQLEAKSWDELGMDPQVLVEECGPHRLIPALAGPDDDPAALPDPVPYERAAQEKRLRSAERQLTALGRVNPLALEEYAALEERHAFLATQLDDLTRSKRDLVEVIREVDERVERVFAQAYQDTAAHFEQVFARLFPGGQGRLVLTDPGSLLTTGVDVEARPPGKKIKRLSLLSGGERSLVAVALLVAIFKARPSPFYVLDEVEAALDDANLSRLLVLLEELRDSSQLIVITHQKKTMEIADALYGVTMRGDGVSTVVSQRIRDAAPTRSAS